MKSEMLDKIVNNTANRRAFMKRAGATGLGLAAMTVLGGSAEKLDAATTFTDVDILNFALNLEYLEGEFYAVATFGRTLEQLGIIPPSAVGGPTTGGAMVNFSGSSVAFLASALRYDEEQHVILLRNALGSAAVKKPAINLNALGYGFANVDDFLKLSRQFEDVGVSAYLGAAPLIQSKAYLLTAAEILATEAQHSGSIRLEVIQHGVNSPAVDSLDVVPSEQNPYDVNSMALSIPRSPAQVLNIVYAGGKCSGGFYPSGMNGTIVCRS